MASQPSTKANGAASSSLLITLLIAPPLLAVTLFVLAYVLTTFWVHGNTRMPEGWDRRVRQLIITPDMHRSHHSVIASETNSNYGGLLSIWDRLFGTYVDEPLGGHEGMEIGLREFPGERHLHLGPMLANPFLNGAARLSGAAKLE